jgi:GNAT superfamily N-acetyltransferase
MPDIPIRPRTPEDDERIVAIYNRVHHDALPLTVEEYRHFMTVHPQNVGWEVWVVEEGGEVVASLDLVGVWSAREPGAWEVYLYVADEHAGRGIGSRLYRHLEERAAAVDARRLYVNVREDRPESRRFAEERGFMPTGRVDRYVRLDVAAARTDGLEELETRLAREGIEIVTLAEIGLENERFLRALHVMNEEALADIPRSEEFQPRSYEDWLHHSLLWPGNSPEWCWVAIRRDEEGLPWPVGICRLRRQGNAGFHGLTATGRGYRGRGIALAMKLRAIRWAQENGIVSLHTGNDEENLPIRAINRRLGYEPLPGSVELLKVLP